MTFTYEDESQALAHLAYYQELLRLQDWDVELAFHVSAATMGSLTAQAHVHWDLQHRKARVKLIDPADYQSELVELDEEHSIVHELLHLKMVDFDNTESGTLEGHLQESFINQLSAAIVNLRRERDEAHVKAAHFEANLLASQQSLSKALQITVGREKDK